MESQSDTENRVTERDIGSYSDFRGNILSTISKKGSLKILRAAESGLKTGKGKWEEFGLSKRQYYSRLRSLKDSDLIEKVDNEYLQTELGRQVHEILISMKRMAENGDNLDLARSIQESEEALSSEQQKAKEFLERKPFLSDIKLKRTKLMDVITDYEELRNKLVGVIRNAKDEIYFVSDYADHNVIKALTELDEEVDFKALVTKNLISRAGEFLRALWNPQDLKEFTETTQNSIRVYPNLPYSFVLVDGNWVAIEVKNPLIPDKFFLCLILKGEELYKTQKGLFEDLYEGTDNESVSDLIKENIF